MRPQFIFSFRAIRFLELKLCGPRKRRAAGRFPVRSLQVEPLCDPALLLAGLCFFWTQRGNLL